MEDTITYSEGKQKNVTGTSMVIVWVRGEWVEKGMYMYHAKSEGLH